MDILQKQQTLKLTANLLTFKLICFQTGVFTNLQASELTIALTTYNRTILKTVKLYNWQALRLTSDKPHTDILAHWHTCTLSCFKMAEKTHSLKQCSKRIQNDRWPQTVQNDRNKKKHD